MEQGTPVKVCRLCACLDPALYVTCMWSQLPTSGNVQAARGPCAHVPTGPGGAPRAGRKLGFRIYPRLTEPRVPFPPCTLPPRSRPSPHHETPPHPQPQRRVQGSDHIHISAEEMWNCRTTAGALFLFFPGTGANLFAQ